MAMRAAGGAPSPQQPGQPAIGATAAAAAADAGGAAIVPPIEKVCRQVGGHPTELLELPATACERPDVQLLVMPGNPGAALYYTSFMRELHSRLHGRASVHAVSNLGMDSQGLTPRGRVHSLQEQVEHKAALLRERYVGEGRPPLVLLAHSIGEWWRWLRGGSGCLLDARWMPLPTCPPAMPSAPVSFSACLLITCSRAGTYMAIHAVERLEKHHLRSSRAATAALDAVAREEWEHPGGAAAGDDGASLERVQQQLLAARAAQQAGPASGGGDAEGAEDGSTAGEAGAAGAAAASNVIKVCGLYPFLEVDPACSKQRRLQRLARYHAAFSRLSGVLGAVLPRALLQRVVRLASPDLEPHAVDTTLQGEWREVWAAERWRGRLAFVPPPASAAGMRANQTRLLPRPPPLPRPPCAVFTDPDCVNNGLYMGLTEFEALAAPADWWLLRALGPRFCLFAAPNDVWFKARLR